MSKDFNGVAEVAMNNTTIPAQLLSEVSVEVTQGTRERSTLLGTFTRNSGTLETAQAMFTLYLPNIDYLQYIVPNQYTDGTGEQLTGQVKWGTGSCTVDDIPVNIHPTCNETDDNDIFFPSASVVLNFNPTFNNSDEMTVEVTVYGNPDDNGDVVIAGTQDLDEPSVYDAETETTEPLGS